ncbi:four helix bundle protein [Fulvivirgaceae bacterium BMA10]|uniref:Four helix bundle protein n=1 Tax=Splendidivirga corallicola TaxID=3051826 RepID=A0ABT8KQW4_9BACT|nr:four helix bundle protein [Fulvivirgaceae bacterium BMA10]
MHNFRELKVWQNARTLVKQIYDISRSLPENEKYGLIQQIRRSAVSIPSNIAEGSGKMGNKEFTHFLRISLGSAYELETQLILAHDLEFITDNELNNTMDNIQEIQRMIVGLEKSLANS